MDDQQIRKIVQDEMQKNFRAGTPKVPPHIHDGISNTKISQSNIVPNIKGVGSIKMATEGQVYTFNLTSSPSAVLFYGSASSNSGSGFRAIVNGNAQLCQGSVFVGTNTSTVSAGTLQNIIQCSDALLIDKSSLANTALSVSELHLVFVQDPSFNELVVADVISFTNTSVTVKLTTLASGWSITGNFLII